MCNSNAGSMEELAASICLLRVFIYRQMQPAVTLGFAMFNAASDVYNVFVMTVERKKRAVEQAAVNSQIRHLCAPTRSRPPRELDQMCGTNAR